MRHKKNFTTACYATYQSFLVMMQQARQSCKMFNDDILDLHHFRTIVKEELKDICCHQKQYVEGHRRTLLLESFIFIVGPFVKLVLNFGLCFTSYRCIFPIGYWGKWVPKSLTFLSSMCPAQLMVMFTFGVDLRKSYGLVLQQSLLVYFL